MYPKTVAGLMTCYTVGVPYFRRDLAGDLLFTAVMFASPLALVYLSKAFDRNGDHTAAA